MKIIKKISISLILVIALVLSFSAVAFATNDADATANQKEEYVADNYDTSKTATISDDCNTLYYNGYTYSPVETDDLYYQINYNEDIYDVEEDIYDVDDEGLYGYNDDGSYDVNPEDYYGVILELSGKQQKRISEVELICSDYVRTKGLMFDANISFRNGTSLFITFLRDDYLESYKSFIEGTSKEYSYVVDFWFSEQEQISVSEKELFENEAEMLEFDGRNPFYYMTETFDVCRVSKDSEFLKVEGVLIFDSETSKLYYVDYKENNIKNDEEAIEIFYDEDEEMVLTAHEIFNENLIASAKKDVEAMYGGSDLGLIDAETAKTISIIFLSFLFSVLPAIALVVSVIYGFKCKGAYKKLLFAVSALSLIEIAVFIITAFVIFK